MTTWAEAAAYMVDVVGRLSALQGQLQAWTTGTVDGGPNGDGRYPFTQPDGYILLVPCPAKLNFANGDPADAYAQLQAYADQASAGAAAVAETQGKLSQFIFDLPATTLNGRPFQPTLLSFDLQPMMGVYLDDGDFWSANLQALEETVARHDAGLAGFTFLDEPMSVDGRLLVPTVLSFDLQPIAGYWADNGEPYDADMTQTKAAKRLAARFVEVEPIAISGRLVQPTLLSFDLQPLQGFYVDTGDPFPPSGGGSAVTAMRIDARGPNLAYLITPRPVGGGCLAFRFQRNVGGSGASDTGPPWQPWRRTGVGKIADLEDDPAGVFTGTPPAGQVTYNLDGGPAAIDYAIARVSGGPFAGSYHGGEVVHYVDQPDFTVTQRFDHFSSRHTSRVTWADGYYYDVDYELEIDSKGYVRERLTYYSKAAVNTCMIGMEVGSNTRHVTPAQGFSEVVADGVAYTVDVASETKVSLGTASDVTMRNPTNGYFIRSISDAPASYLAGGETYAQPQTDNRVKLYYSRGAGVLGRVTVNRTIIFGED